MAVVMVNVTIHIYQNLILDVKDFSMHFYQFINLTQQRIDLTVIRVYVWEGLIQSTDSLERNKFTLGLAPAQVSPPKGSCPSQMLLMEKPSSPCTLA